MALKRLLTVLFISILKSVDNSLLTEYPNVLFARGILQEPSTRTLEDTITLNGSNSLELGSGRIQDARVEGGTLCDI